MPHLVPVRVDRLDQYQHSLHAIRQTIAYMRGGTLLVPSTTQMPDRVDISGSPIPNSVYTDGVWVWEVEAREYADRYGMVLPDEFIRRAEAHGYICPTVGEETLARLRSWHSGQAG